ncbi:hypothetical protein BaRGS_00020504 [Batillaria attramentaria]|uniref:Uncharacterized protein n=1 Tax=Batillaria attramentaria TaxID=370345 RepID=A0ABD0KM72_9CAEN
MEKATAKRTAKMMGGYGGYWPQGWNSYYKYWPQWNYRKQLQLDVEQLRADSTRTTLERTTKMAARKRNTFSQNAVLTQEMTTNSDQVFQHDGRLLQQTGPQVVEHVVTATGTGLAGTTTTWM